MDVKEIISQIKEKLGDDNFTKVEALLDRAEGLFRSLSEDLDTVNGESKRRKFELRKLKSTLDDKDAEIEDWKEKAGDSKNADKIKILEDENKTLKEFRENIQKKTREIFKTKFDEVVKTDAFKKAADKFKLPKPDEKGVYDLSKLSDEDIDYNNLKLEEYTELGIFQTNGAKNIDGHPGAHNSAQNLINPGSNENVQKINSEDDLNNYFEEAIKEY